jgi:hypothetical protein
VNAGLAGSWHQDNQGNLAISWGTHRNGQLIRTLGQGGEGTVYLVKDGQSGIRYAVKIFLSPRPIASCRGLQIYSDRVADGESLGLPKIELIENEDQLLGVAYQHRQLYKVNHHVLGSVDQVAQSLVGSYCQKQYHLMRAGDLALWDADSSNFLLRGDGVFQWVDFGWGVAPTNGPVCIERGLFGYGFAILLLSLYNKPAVESSEGYSYAQPCRYCMDSRLDVLAHEHTWLRDILAEVRSQPSTVFLQPEFWRRLGTRLPHRVTSAWTVILASGFLNKASRVKQQLRRLVRGGQADSRVKNS